MAEIKYGRVKPFGSLPDEIVINIFSYFNTNELTDILQNVCRRWKRLAHDPALWRDKEYAIIGRRVMERGRNCCGVHFSECVHCRCQQTDEEVLRSVGTMPQLRRLTIMRPIRGRVLRKLCISCPNLTRLQIESNQNVNFLTVKHIFQKCPKIQKLKLPASMLRNGLLAGLLSTLEHLTCLVVFEDLWSMTPVRLRDLVGACPQLEELHTDCSYYNTRDMEYVLKAKTHSLTSATLRWMSEGWQNWCVVTLLKQLNTSVRKLRLLHYNVPPEMEAEVFEALGDLHNLQELRAERVSPHTPLVMSLAFKPGCLTQLRRLQLQGAANLQNETVLTISQGCPNLCELRLSKSALVTDEALSEIYLLKHLEILELSGCNGLGGTAIAHIAELPALHTLVLQHVRDLQKLLPSLRDIVDMGELRFLDILQSDNIEAVPFSEFPGKLLKLRELRVTYDSQGENVVTDLQHKMPHLKVFETFRYTEEDLSGDIDRGGVDEYYAGGDYYYGNGGDDDDDDDDYNG
ncbi:F-box/LRR-repeat protein 7-like isoform X1 [Schistocerca nitens]|uniref:F-box/LRR-repeat protein 7-like isoform X1 n=2 Tax=Schistocerca nitens TaxID=7011 RepID=UPI0021196691|nr:F-box/LRR-repeat protein 7-like isoform X1 [Schistocerca nitens]